ncbi:hypothetical protein [Burkholderia ubonensis]|uniref:hypothetical protein n=1 Tax=Burkholderia ubonensis TaxID=101571 RepID=UPI0012F8759A
MKTVGAQAASVRRQTDRPAEQQVAPHLRHELASGASAAEQPDQHRATTSPTPTFGVDPATFSGSSLPLSSDNLLLFSIKIALLLTLGRKDRFD